MTQSVKGPTSAQVMVSCFMVLNPALGSVLTAQILKPASDSMSPSLSLLLPCSLSVSVCVSVTVSLSLKDKYALNFKK